MIEVGKLVNTLPQSDEEIAHILCSAFKLWFQLFLSAFFECVKKFFFRTITIIFSSNVFPHVLYVDKLYRLTLALKL